MGSDREELAGSLICLSQMVDQLKTEGLAHAGEYEGLFAYAVLDRLKSHAEVYGVPLEDIGLKGFNPDTLLHKPSKAE